MALFPDAEFEVLLASPGVVIPGTRLEGTLEIRVPESIPRAQRIDLFYRTMATVSFSQDPGGYVRDLLVVPFHVDIDTSRPMAAGRYAYPFSFDVPPWLPPAYEGPTWSIRHRIDVRLDVDWAKDPTKTFYPLVVLPPVVANAETLVLRSPRGWHSTLVVDVTLDRTVLTVGEPVMGEIALRGGEETEFDALEVSLRSRATMAMTWGDRRYGAGRKVRIPASDLRGGEAVRFKLEFPPDTPSTFRTGFVDHDVVFGVHAVLPWSNNPRFEVAVQAVPSRSRVRGPSDASPVMLGTDRLNKIAAAMASATGLARGRLPLLVEGQVGPIHVRMTDGPRGGGVGLDIDFELPDLGLGIVFRPQGKLLAKRIPKLSGRELDISRQSPLLPRRLAGGSYLLRVGGPESVLVIPPPEEALKKLFAALFYDLEPQNEARLTDRHLGFHLVLRSDNLDEMVKCAAWAKSRAEAVAAAIAELPFAALHPEAEAAWKATAREENGFLLPHIPAIHGLSVSTQILGGELRELGVTLRTRHDRTIAADLDLRTAPLPSGAGTPPPAVQSVFPIFRVHSAEKSTLDGAPFAPDPRSLLSTLEVFLSWLLEVRGERRSESAYR